MQHLTATRGLLWVCGVPLALALLLVGNYHFAVRYLVRLETPKDPFAGIERHLEPISSPVVFATGRDTGFGPDPGLFLASFGLSPGSLPGTSDYLIPIDQVARANPYPQPLDVVYGRSPNFMSLGYIGTDEQYHQVTFYWGETDTTPSLLTRKVRGAATGHGDHFIRYTVFLSRRLTPRPSIIEMKTGRIAGWEQPPIYPNVNRVDWSTYRSGPYDGLEQIWFALAATCLEVLVIGFFWRRRENVDPGKTS